MGAREASPLSIIMIDVDHFKEFNDQYGHIAGDECLKRIGDALTKHIKRRTDSVCRFGGEEFVCILPKTGSDQAVEIAESLRGAVEEMKIAHAHHEAVGYPYVTISLGVATTVPHQGLSAIELIHEADKMLYLSKDYGRNRLSKTTL